MCGIAGGWWVDTEQAVNRLPLALKKIKHRGPDDDGYQVYSICGKAVVLGHTRLSIIDLSDAGHQPMNSSDGRWAIVFNGEIYNYRELRNELQMMGHSFSSDSDTEVLLAAWSEWGVASLHRLVGMFAFAVVDKISGTLTCVRDAFGIKPLYYSVRDHQFSFASELPALLELLPSKPSLNLQRSYDFMVHGDYDSSQDTFYAGVLQLPPGHLLHIRLESGKVTQPQCWWRPQLQERLDLSFDDAVEKTRAQFLQNIRLHLRSDVPLGAALSGGVDSSAVVCAMRYVEPNLPIHTFSYIANGSDVNEEFWVDRINAKVGAISHKVHVTDQELIADLDDMIKIQGEPFGGTSIYAQYRVFRLAKECGISVTLDGQGADELLCGYNGYPGQRLLSLIETGQISEACTFLSEWSKWPGRGKMNGLKALIAELSGGKLYTVLKTLNGDQYRPSWINEKFLLDSGVSLKYPKKAPEFTLKGRRVIAELGASLTQRGLGALLRHGDRNSMRFSIESRVPFLTTEFADLLLSLPEKYLIGPNGETKRIFRAAMRGIVPDDILDRKDKIGFATPEKNWLIKIAPEIRKSLSASIDVPFINQKEMLNHFDDVVSGIKPFTWQVWRWLNFYRWHALK